MTKEEKLDKVCNAFSALSEEKQEYIIGILQALVFAANETSAIRKMAIKQTPEVRK
ncbi:hypothetical protein [Treponema primitia]|uniref:hypothetical protein n=1 Tax=Treponema primitia TaxID=88058 RepID=UPI0002DE9D60|nr:hypothetical protein [Treponema primitia]